MRIVRYVSAWVAALLLAQAILYGQEWQNPLAPQPEAKLLELVVGRTQTCGAHLEGKTEPDKGDVALAEKLSMKLLFRPGRFKLKWEADSETAEGKRETVISFNPLPEEERLGPADNESEDLNKVLNRLSGTVHIDPVTQNITRIYGDLTEAVWVKPHWFPLRLSSLSFRYYQTSGPGGWRPERLNVEAEGYFVTKHFPLRFDCGS